MQHSYSDCSDISGSNLLFQHQANKEKTFSDLPALFYCRWNLPKATICKRCIDPFLVLWFIDCWKSLSKLELMIWTLFKILSMDILPPMDIFKSISHFNERICGLHHKWYFNHFLEIYFALRWSRSKYTLTEAFSEQSY